jgi:predicted PurR-regulated permease PerM
MRHHQLELTEPRPSASLAGFWRQAAQFATVGIFLILFGAVLDMARLILLPIATAVVIGTMLGPLARIAGKWRIPAWVFATVTILLVIVVLQIITVVISAPLIDWIGRAPQFVDTVKAKLGALQQGFTTFHALREALGVGGGTAGMTVDFAALVQPTIAFLTPTLGEIAIFLATLFFALLDRDDLRKHLILVFEDQEDRLRAIRILNDIERNLARYIGTVSMINVGIGVITAIGAWLLGFDNPALLGLLAFGCNYIPYIGPAVVVAVLFVVGLISFPSLAYAAVPPLLFILLTTLEGHFVTPNIVGRRLTLNPLGVFLSLAFWTWLWGPVGAFLSVPFLIYGMVIVSHFVAEEEGELPA